MAVLCEREGEAAVRARGVGRETSEEGGGGGGESPTPIIHPLPQERATGKFMAAAHARPGKGAGIAAAVYELGRGLWNREDGVQ